VLTSLWSRWHRECAGQDLIEYALVAAFVAIVVLAGASGLGVSVNDWFAGVAGVADEGGKKSNCSAKGMVHSNGKCHGL
jgi:pilus assembly protein Flp/PilA